MIARRIVLAGALALAACDGGPVESIQIPPGALPGTGESIAQATEGAYDMLVARPDTLRDQPANAAYALMLYEIATVEAASGRLQDQWPGKLMREALDESLFELCRGAEDIDPALHSFKNAQQLRVGVRDILGKERIEATTGALTDIAETCLAAIARVEYEKLVAKLGEPRFERALKQLLDASEAGMRAVIGRIPDGTYAFEDRIDDDGITAEPIVIFIDEVEDMDQQDSIHPVELRPQGSGRGGDDAGQRRQAMDVPQFERHAHEAGDAFPWKEDDPGDGEVGPHDVRGDEAGQPEYRADRGELDGLRPQRRQAV